MVIRIEDAVPSNDPWVVFDVSNVSKSAAQLAQARVKQAADDAVLVAANEAQTNTEQAEAASRSSRAHGRASRGRSGRAAG